MASCRPSAPVAPAPFSYPCRPEATGTRGGFLRTLRPGPLPGPRRGAHNALHGTAAEGLAPATEGGRMYRFVFAALLALTASAAPAGEAEAPSLLLANVYRDDVDLDRYWVSEKLDGVRAYWDGERLRSRKGNPINAPSWFVEHLPRVPLDGELWMGRGTFERLSGAVRRRDPDEAQWRGIRFMVFDLPSSPATFDRRLQRLREMFETLASPHVALVEHFRVAGRAELMERLDRVVAGGGEGLMLHRGGSRYAGGRSDDLLKLKKHQDAEAVVIGHLPGKGRLAGLLGALLVETPEGLRFRLGSGFSDDERRDPPPPGATVTYKYYGKTRKGVPRFASFLRVRNGI